jgi:hypothetical protein
MPDRKREVIYLEANTLSEGRRRCGAVWAFSRRSRSVGRRRRRRIEVMGKRSRGRAAFENQVQLGAMGKTWIDRTVAV